MELHERTTRALFRTDARKLCVDLATNKESVVVEMCPFVLSAK